MYINCKIADFLVLYFLQDKLPPRVKYCVTNCNFLQFSQRHGGQFAVKVDPDYIAFVRSRLWRSFFNQFAIQVIYCSRFIGKQPDSLRVLM